VKKILLYTMVALLLAVCGFGVAMILHRPNMTRYLPLRDPQLSVKADQKVLEIQFSGKPDVVLMPAFKQLFKTYFSLKGVPKTKFPAPLARYYGPINPVQNADELSKNFGSTEWKGAVAVPIPETVTELPASKPGEPFIPTIATWQYGEVAEILHLGPYDQEVPTIRKLLDFIDSQACVIVGQHEEEYLIGPGMPFVRPAGYYTLIRYRVQKTAAPAATAK
jgi:effector-binding domain-containing protein